MRRIPELLWATEMRFTVHSDTLPALDTSTAHAHKARSPNSKFSSSVFSIASDYVQDVKCERNIGLTMVQDVKCEIGRAHV